MDMAEFIRLVGGHGASCAGNTASEAVLGHWGWCCFWWGTHSAVATPAPAGSPSTLRLMFPAQPHPLAFSFTEAVLL